jgi:hypothetical protein
MRRGQNRANTILLKSLAKPDAIQVGDTRTLEVAKEDSIINVSEEIHIAPRHRDRHDNRKLCQE